MLKRLSQNTLILLVSNVGGAILSFLLAVLIGRYYGENGLGLYAGVLAWIYPLSFIVEFGFGTLITRDIAQRPDLASEYLRLTWQFRIIVGGSLIILLCGLSHRMVDQPLSMVISTPLLITLPAYSAYTAIFRAHQRMIPIAFLNPGMLIAQVVFTGFAIITSVDLIWLFIINTMTSVAQLLGAWWTYHRYFYEKPKSQYNLRLRDLIRQSRPFAFAGILSALQTRFSILWLETVSTPMIVGLFVAALRFTDGARMIPNALFGAIYPTLSSIANNRPTLNKLFMRMLMLLSIYGASVTVICYLFAEDILLLTFGENFILAAPALVIMMVSLIPFLLRSGWSLYWYALGREKAVNRILIINLLTLVIIASGIYHVERDLLNGIVMAIFYTEVITLVVILISEIILWKLEKTSSSITLS